MITIAERRIADLTRDGRKLETVQPTLRPNTGLLTRFNGNTSASRESLARVEAELGLRLPDDYADFLLHVNGGEGFIGDAYMILWRAEELLERSNEYQVAACAPGLLLFGSDGGGEAFAFDMRSWVKPVISVPFIVMELDAIRPMALSFSAFLEVVSRSSSFG